MISVGDLVFIKEDIDPFFFSKNPDKKTYLKKDQVGLIVGIRKQTVDNEQKIKYKIFIDGKVWGLSNNCVTKITQK